MNTEPLLIVEDVLFDMARLSLEDRPIKIILPFKGMLLIQSIKILEVGEKYVILQSPRQEISFALNDFIFLHSQDLSQTITAHLEKINLTDGQMTISNLKYTGKCWQERDSQRVQPKNPIIATIQAGKARFHADIEDISLTGAGILGYRIIEKGIHLQHADPVTMYVKLSNEQQPLVLHGTVVNIHSHKNGMVRIGVQFNRLKTYKHGLLAYINLRQNELDDELNHFIPEMLEACSSVHLYF